MYKSKFKQSKQSQVWTTYVRESPTKVILVAETCYDPAESS